MYCSADPSLQKLTPEEQRLLRLYGKLPTKKDLLQNKLKVDKNTFGLLLSFVHPWLTDWTAPSFLPLPLKERKYFDSGDYALSKAGKASDVGVTTVGSRHPVPENIPHATTASTSPPAVSPSPAAPGASAYPTAHSPMKESSVLNHQTSSDDIKEHRRNEHNEEQSTSGSAAEPTIQQS